jgi:glucosamine--fructose-6-phosphate aminotransferase (isomerizing)
LANVTDFYVPVDDKEMVILEKTGYKIFSSGQEIQKETIVSEKNNIEQEMGDFEHFMLKEIFEVPNIIENVL